MDLSKDFYKNVEQKNYLKYVLYSDTDSIYISVPENIKQYTPEKKIELAKRVSEDINSNIINYLKNTYFKRANINPDKNYTFFKTEVIIDSIMFIPDVKKQYAYKVLVEDNKVFDSPEIRYKGLQIVKIDVIKLSQKLLKEMIENIILNNNINKKEKLNCLIELVNNIRNEFLESCNTFDIDNIGIPSKWNKDETIVNAMKIYNFIIGRNIFAPASSGKFVYCKFKNVSKFASVDVEQRLIKAVCFPQNFPQDIIKQKFEEFQITIDRDEQWKRIYTTTCQRLVDLVKKETQK